MQAPLRSSGPIIHRPGHRTFDIIVIIVNFDVVLDTSDRSLSGTTVFFHIGIMNKNLLTSLLITLCVLLCSCCNDDELPLELTGDYLNATSWDAVETTTADNGATVSTRFIMEFTSNQNGHCIDTYGDNSYAGRFTYTINKTMINFSGSIIGNWTVIERSSSKIVMRSFMPREHRLTLTKLPG